MIDKEKLYKVFPEKINYTQKAILNQCLKCLPEVTQDRSLYPYILSIIYFYSKFRIVKEVENAEELYGILGDPVLARRLGNTKEGEGKFYQRRGLLPICGKSFYKLFGKNTAKYMKNFDISLTPSFLTTEREVASMVAIIGLVEGLFTGVKVSSIPRRDKIGIECYGSSYDYEEILKLSKKIEEVLKE